MRTALLLILLAACAPDPAGGPDNNDGSAGADGTTTGGDGSADGSDGTTDGSDGSDGTQPPLENRLQNPGFEQGASWWRPEGVISHAWSRTGDPVYGGSTTFTPLGGNAGLKIWGAYAGSVPNDSEHGLTLVDVTPGDTHTFSVQATTLSPDVLNGTSAVAFLRYFDTNGSLLEQSASDPMDSGSEPDVWHTLRTEATVPQGAVTGQLGVRFSLPSWDAGGAVYLDDAVWTSTGSGDVSGERLLVWHDEFDGTALDTSKWSPEIIPAYTYNNEIQRYTNNSTNTRIENGHIVLTARQESNGEVTSARLVSRGRGDWLYGRIEGMLVVPRGVGTWPALWMLPTDNVYGGWPSSGEIDIMEHVGCDPNVVHATVHTGAYNHMLGTQRGGSTGTDATGSAHLYAVDWDPDRIVFTVDNLEIFRFNNDGTGNSETWPFDQRFHIVMNLAFGGDWGGYCGVDYGSLPQEYRLDWVRVYQ